MRVSAFSEYRHLLRKLKPPYATVATESGKITWKQIEGHVSSELIKREIN